MVTNILTDSSDAKQLFGFQKKAQKALQNIPQISKKNESYQYYPLGKLQREHFSLGHGVKVEKDGEFEGAILEDLEVVYPTYKVLLENYYQKLIGEEKDYFALLSYALSEKCLFIHIPNNLQLSKPIDIRHILPSQGSGLAFVTSVILFMGKNSKATIRLDVQSDNSASQLFSRAVNLHLDEGAQLQIESDLTEAKNLWHFDSLRADLKKDANLNFVSGSLGSKALRQDFRVDLLGPNANVSLKGVQLLDANCEAYNHVLVNHRAENCESNQHFKQVVFDKGKGVFEGKIFVESQAQKTNAYQLCNSLTLGDKALAIAKPNLEIFADDVKASHGATISKLGSSELFYLLSRGLSKKDAKRFLVKGFCSEITELMSQKKVKDNCFEVLNNMRDIDGR